MKAAAFFLLMSTFSTLAHAGLDHTVGTANVDTFYQTQDMQLEISGQAAQQMYEQLQISDSGSSVKIGPGIICRKDPFNGEKPAWFRCDLNVHADGTVTK